MAAVCAVAAIYMDLIQVIIGGTECSDPRASLLSAEAEWGLFCMNETKRGGENKEGEVNTKPVAG